MNLIALNSFLRQLRLGGIAAVLETRLQQAQAEPMAPIDFLSCLVSDELTVAATDCWNGAGNKRNFAIRRSRLTTSISTSTRR